MLERAVQVAHALREDAEVVVGRGQPGLVAQTLLRNEIVGEVVASRGDVAELRVGYAEGLTGLGEQRTVGRRPQGFVCLLRGSERLVVAAALDLDPREDHVRLGPDRGLALIEFEIVKLGAVVPCVPVVAKTQMTLRDAYEELCGLHVGELGSEFPSTCLNEVAKRVRVAVRTEIDVAESDGRQRRVSGAA